MPCYLRGTINHLTSLEEARGRCDLPGYSYFIHEQRGTFTVVRCGPTPLWDHQHAYRPNPGDIRVDT